MVRVLRGTEESLNFSTQAKNVIGYEDQEGTVAGVVWAGGSKYFKFIIPGGVIVVCTKINGSVELKVGDGVNSYPDLPSMSVSADLGFNITYGSSLPDPDTGSPGDIFMLYSDLV